MRSHRYQQQQRLGRGADESRAPPPDLEGPPLGTPEQEEAAFERCVSLRTPALHGAARRCTGLTVAGRLVDLRARSTGHSRPSWKRSACSTWPARASSLHSTRASTSRLSKPPYVPPLLRVVAAASAPRGRPLARPWLTPGQYPGSRPANTPPSSRLCSPPPAVDARRPVIAGPDRAGRVF